MPQAIWIHAGCASGEDERVEPIFYSKDQCCQYCGEYGKVFLYEMGADRELVADGEGNLVKNGLIDARTVILMARSIEEREEAESNVSIPIHVDVVDEKEMVLDSMDAEIPITIDKENMVVHADMNESISELERLSARIAQLERELKENSTG